jgi:outer membrane protein assembly factor BamB
MPVGSRQILVQMMASSFAAVDPQDGTPLWRQPFQNRHSVHANTPVFAGNIVFSTAGYGHGGVAMKVSADGRTATEAYVNKDFAVHHGGQVLVDGHVYAATDKGAMCMELATGRTKWGPEPAISKGSITFADGLLYCYSENGKLSLVKASPQSCAIISSFPITQGSGTHWAHPVIAGGRLYIRHGEALLAYEIKAN